MSKLSEKVRPNVEAAPWVIYEIANLEDQLTEAQAEIERLRGALRTIFDKLPDHFALEYEDWKRIKAALAEGRVEENQCAHGIKSLTNCPWCNKPTLGVVV